jgi:hypothetical protein
MHIVAAERANFACRARPAAVHVDLAVGVNAIGTGSGLADPLQAGNSAQAIAIHRAHREDAACDAATTTIDIGLGAVDHTVEAVAFDALSTEANPGLAVDAAGAGVADGTGIAAWATAIDAGLPAIDDTVIAPRIVTAPTFRAIQGDAVGVLDAEPELGARITGGSATIDIGL